MSKSIRRLLDDFNIIFWDFDGVIKDSLSEKALAFEKLFAECDQNIITAIKNHHFQNSGVSRYEKIPIYLSWAGKPLNSFNIKKYSENFSSIVKRSVIDSPWVPGVKDYLESNYGNKIFIIVTATPRFEICEILKELEIFNFFDEIYGSSVSKSDALRDSIERFQIKRENAIMIGDSKNDFKAAIKNNIFFALKRSSHNLSLQKSLDCFKFKDFLNE